MDYCKNKNCSNLARQGMACCSQNCRDLVPNCNVVRCKNAVEYSIYKGNSEYTKFCYKHGGRVAFDGEIKESYQRRSMITVNKKI